MRVIHSPLLHCHIDLDSISAIGDAQLFEKRSILWVVYFEVHLKLHDYPLGCDIQIKPEHGPRREGGGYYFLSTTGSWVDPNLVDHQDLAAVAEVQNQINQLINQWRGND